ncbi:unnamed protein product, partial [Mesorhabditis belari]|uniref:Prefoldin subunit 3 n=1 Tax=Mesorhabditis belari TaxID=2138241 RepID=A0AAF3EK20_9BILA
MSINFSESRVGKMEETVGESKRGIPLMKAVEDVAQWLKSEGEISGEDGRGRLDEQYRKYKMIEAGMAQQRLRLMEKIPEFQNSLRLIDTLIEKKEKGESFETSPMISEEVWTKATVKEPKTVSIWIGANIMVEYELDKAKQLIIKNHKKLNEQLAELNHELAFVKDQITTTEVNIAHVHNHVVKQRRLASMRMAAAN